jgi:nucleotide-binding universal stress UspA family protein
MQPVKAGQDRYLRLDTLAADPKLARRLPPDLAWRYHALPLAEANGRVTVAMADPDDAEAREAVFAALGPMSCVVKGSALTIDERLSEIWGDDTHFRLKLEVCAFPEPLPDELSDYSQALSTLLRAHLGRLGTAAEMNAFLSRRRHARCDLVITAGPACGKHGQLLTRRLLSRSTANGTLASQPSVAPPAILVAQCPRWPLERILLLLCGEGADNGAVAWALRLARASTAVVTVLAVVPPVPAMYSGLSRMEQGMAGLLTADTALGRQMRQVAQRLAECRVDGTLRLRQGAPDQQICREAVEGDHDLIAMAARPCRWWLRQLKGDPICSLLRRVDRPVLLAEPPTT